MKRSEANAILKARVEFSTEYSCASIAKIDGLYYHDSDIDQFLARLEPEE